MTRQELYERVWQTPTSKLTKEFGISDSGLGKICKRHNIPKPPLGYWAKVASGKPVERIKLPPSDDPRKERIWITGRKPPQLEADTSPEFSSDIAAALAAIEQRPPIRVMSVESAHPLVARTHELLASTHPDENGLVRVNSGDALDTLVSPKSTPRAVAILHALVMELEACGIASCQSDDGAKFDVFGESLRVSLKEETDRHRRPATPEETRANIWNQEKKYYRHEPNGRLRLRIHPPEPVRFPLTWADGKTRRTEDALKTCIETLLRAAGAIKRERSKREAEAAREAAWKVERRQAIAEIKAEEALLDELHVRAASWTKAEELRRFVDALEAAESRGEIETHGGYVSWARDHAARLDPLSKSPPSILDEREKWKWYSPPR